MVEHVMHTFHLHVEKEIRRIVNMLCILKVIVKLYAIGERGGGEAQGTN